MRLFSFSSSVTEFDCDSPLWNGLTVVLLVTTSSVTTSCTPLNTLSSVTPPLPWFYGYTVMKEDVESSGLTKSFEVEFLWKVFVCYCWGYLWMLILKLVLVLATDCDFKSMRFIAPRRVISRVSSLIEDWEVFLFGGSACFKVSPNFNWRGIMLLDCGFV